MRMPWLIAFGAFAVATPAILLQSPLQTAKAKLYLPRQDIDTTGVARIIDLDFSQLNRLLPVDTAQRFNSFEIVRNTLTDLKMPSDEKSVVAMQSHLRSRLVAGTNTVEIHVQHADAATALRFANAWIDVTNRARRASEDALIDRLTENLDREAGRIKEELRPIYAALMKGREAVPFSLLSLLEGNRSDLNGMELERQQILSELDLLARGGDGNDGMASVRSKRYAVEQLEGNVDTATKRVDAEAKLAATRRTYGSNTKQIAESEAELTTRQQELRYSNMGQKQLLETRLAAFDRNIELLRAELAQNLKKIDEGLNQQLTPDFEIHSLKAASLETQLKQVDLRHKELSVYRQTPRSSLIVLDPPRLFHSRRDRSIALFLAAAGSILLGISLHLLTGSHTRDVY